MVKEPGYRSLIGEHVTGAVALYLIAGFIRSLTHLEIGEQLPGAYIEPGGTIDPVSGDVVCTVVRMHRVFNISRPFQLHLRIRATAAPEIHIRRRVRNIEGIVVGKLCSFNILLECVQPLGQLCLVSLERPGPHIRIPEHLTGMPACIGQHNLGLSARGEVVRPEDQHGELSARYN